MIHQTRSVARHRPAAVGVALAAVAFAATGVLGQSESAAPAQGGSPQASPPILPGEPNPPWEDGATAAAIDPSLVNQRPRTWDHILFAPDGRTVTVYFSNGVPECYGLADVQVSQDGAQVGIELWVGDVPGAEACIDTVQLYRTVIVLDERLITGGSLLDLPSGRTSGL